MSWFFIDESITDGERRQGPFSLDEIREFVGEGKITSKTLVWRSGMSAWIPWEECEESKEPGLAELEASRDELIKNTVEALLREQANTRHYAGFFVRFFAFLIDNCILCLVGGVILLIMTLAGLMDAAAVEEALVNYIGNPSSNEALDKVIDSPGLSTFFSIYGAIQAIYFIVFQAIFSATPGKMFWHIHIETAEGMPLGWLSSTARYLCSLLSQVTLLFYGIGYLIVLIDPKRRALHDWIARTFVVFANRAKGAKKGKPEQEN